MGPDVIDLMGSGFFGLYSNVSSLTGLRFDPFDPNQWTGTNSITRALIPPQILGDIRNDKTWRQLDASMTERGIGSFDLVTLFPVGGWNFSATDLQFLYAFQATVGNVLMRISPTGRFYFDVGPHFVYPRPRGVDYFDDITGHPILETMIENINQNTPFEIRIRVIALRGKTNRVLGVMIPKS